MVHKEIILLNNIKAFLIKNDHGTLNISIPISDELFNRDIIISILKDVKNKSQEGNIEVYFDVMSVKKQKFPSWFIKLESIDKSTLQPSFKPITRHIASKEEIELMNYYLKLITTIHRG